MHTVEVGSMRCEGTACQKVKGLPHGVLHKIYYNRLKGVVPMDMMFALALIFDWLGAQVLS